MSDAKKGKITAFAMEQGFGKVDIEGLGELPFDAVVAQPLDKLKPGCDVMVETGPSRIPGKLKVTKLWMGDPPP